MLWASWALSTAQAGMAWERRHGGFSSSSLQGSGGSPLLSATENHGPLVAVGGGAQAETEGDQTGCFRKGFPPPSPHCRGPPTASRVQMSGAWLPSCDQEAARPVQPGGRN